MSWITVYEQHVLSLSQSQRARSVLIYPDASAHRLFSITKLVTEMHKTLSLRGGGCCPDAMTLSDFWLNLVPLNSPTELLGAAKPPYPTVVSPHVLSLMLHQAWRDGSYQHISPADLPHLLRLLRYIAHSRAFVDDHFSSRRLKPRALVEYLGQPQRLDPAFARYLQPKLVPELTKLLLGASAYLQACGRITMAELIGQKLIAMRVLMQQDPGWPAQALSGYHGLYVAGFLSTTYLEEWLLSQWLRQGRGASSAAPVQFVQTIILPSRASDASAPLAAPSPHQLSPQLSSCVHIHNRGATAPSRPCRRLAMAFDSRTSEFAMMLRLAAELAARGIPPEQMAILLPEPEQYQGLSYATYQLTSSSGGGLQLDLAPSLATAAVGSFMMDLVGYLRSPRSGWDFYHLIVNPALFTTLTYAYLIGYQKRRQEDLEPEWLGQAVEDLSCLKEFLSGFIASAPLSRTAAEIYGQHKGDDGDAAMRSLAALLTRQELPPNHRLVLGRDFFCHSCEFLRPIFELEMSYAATISTPVAPAGLAEVIKLMREYGGLLLQYGLSLREDRYGYEREDERLAQCFDDMSMYFGTLNAEQIRVDYSQLQQVLELVVAEMQRRPLAPPPPDLSGLNILPLERGLMHPYAVVMVAGLSDPLVRSSHEATREWLASGRGVPASAGTPLSLGTVAMGMMWWRIPMQIYGYQVHQDQAMRHLFAEWDEAATLHWLDSAGTASQVMAHLFQDDPAANAAVLAPPLPQAAPSPTAHVSSVGLPVAPHGQVAQLDPTLFASMSPESFDDLLKCPYRFYLRQKRLRGLVLPQTHSHQARGMWLHKLMECFFRGVPELVTQAPPYERVDMQCQEYPPLGAHDDLSAAGLLKRLEQIGEAILAPISFITADQWHQLRLECLPFVAGVFAQLFDEHGWPTHILTEHQLSGEHFHTELLPETAYGTQLTGRIDLWLAFRTGASLLIDYKSSSIPSVRDLKMLKNSQLLLYGHALRQHHPALVYWSLSNNIFQWIYRPPALDSLDPTQLPGCNRQDTKSSYFTTQAELQAVTVEYLEEYVLQREEIATEQRFGIKPAPETCQYCEYTQICRKDDP